MTSMPWKARRALGKRCVSELNCAVARRLRQLLWHWASFSVPKGLYSGIVGICIIILKVWIHWATTATLLVRGQLLSQLRMPCLNPEREEVEDKFCKYFYKIFTSELLMIDLQTKADGRNSRHIVERERETIEKIVRLTRKRDEKGFFLCVPWK